MMNKHDFIEKLNQSPNKRLALQGFCSQYHYFSLHQIQAFSEILSYFPAHDRVSLCELAKTVYEEMGSGHPEKVHSLLFEKFAYACGMDPSLFPIKNELILPEIKEYISALRDSFSSRNVPRALSAYVFLENTAVDMYPLFYTELKKLDFSDEALEFFSEHAYLEPHHLETAQKLVERQNFTQEDWAIYHAEQRVLSEAYANFWKALIEAGDSGTFSSKSPQANL